MTEPAVRCGVRIGAEEVQPEPAWRYRTVEPATGAGFAEIVGGTEAEARRAVRVAADALPGWAQTPAARRAGALREIAARLRTEQAGAELAELVSRETGKRLAEARAEVGLSAAFFEWFADAISVRADSALSVIPGLRHEVSEHALGVVAVLTPWNFPLSIPARKIAPALAAGCPVLFKPAEVAASSALRLAELIEQHVPAGVIGTVLGDPETVSRTWLAERDVRGLTFTGSTRVGRVLAEAAAPRFVRCVLELGGNAPFVVLDDADLDRAVELLLVAKYRNNGQSCIAANQVWVPQASAEEFARRFADASARLVLGDPLDEATALGPLALHTDPARITELVETSGGQREHGVATASGHFLAPAVVLAPARDSALVRTEIFGPAISVLGYREPDEVLDAVRHGDYGLGGYVVGEAGRASAFARALDVGIVGVNTGTPNTPQIPFAGLKDSGLGVEGAHLGLEQFLTTRTVAVSGQ